MKKILLILCFFLQIIGAFAAKPDTLKIQNDETRFLTKQYFLELEDPKNQLLPKNVIDNKGFHSISSDYPRLKYSKSITWLKFTIKNNTTQVFIPITIGKSVIDDFDIYYLDTIIRKGRKEIAIQGLSAKDPIYNTNMLTQSITLINVPVTPDSSRTFYARIKSNATTVIPIEVNSADQFVHKRSIENMVNGAIMGMFIIMALYNLMLLVIIGDKNYLYYVIYIIFLGASQSLLLGFGGNLFPDNLQFLNNYVTPL